MTDNSDDIFSQMDAIGSGVESQGDKPKKRAPKASKATKPSGADDDDSGKMAKLAKMMKSMTSSEPAEEKKAKIKRAKVDSAILDDEEGKTINKKEELINAINNYLNSKYKGERLKKRGFKTTGLEKKSVAALETMLKKIKAACCSQNNSQAFEMMAMSGISTYEKIACSRGLDISGTTMELAMNESFLESLEEVYIDYFSFIRPNSLTRCTMAIAGTSYKKYHENKRAKTHFTAPIHLHKPPATTESPADAPNDESKAPILETKRANNLDEVQSEAAHNQPEDNQIQSEPVQNEPIVQKSTDPTSSAGDERERAAREKILRGLMLAEQL